MRVRCSSEIETIPGIWPANCGHPVVRFRLTMHFIASTRGDILRPHTNRRRGFALVTALLLLVMLAVVAVGMLSLASVELSKSGKELSSRRAQANARLALALAIGNLQGLAGPDQRVTAPSEIESGASGQRRWVGVWRSTKKAGNGESPVVRWDDRDQVIVDGRSADGLQNSDLFEGWLVSGTRGVIPSNPAVPLTKIVGPGSVKSSADEVSVPLVKMVDSKNGKGSYAYWVSDESMKASVTVPKLDQGKTGTTFQQDRYGIGILDHLSRYDSTTSEDLSKVTDVHQAVLATKTAPADWAHHFHSVGSRASAVLSDTVRGGLKSDLSAYFETGSVTSKGGLLAAANDMTPLLNGTRRKTQGPKLGTLRSYAALAGQTSKAGLNPIAASAMTRQDKYSAIPQMSKFINQPVHPVLASAEIYTRFAYVRGYLTVHLYPRIVLWNPYNVRIAPATYTVDFNHSINDSMTIEKRQGGTVDVVNTEYDTRSKKDNRMSFTLDPTTFEPGEALVFSPKAAGSSAIAGRAIPLALRTSGSNTLSASVDPHTLTNFYLTLTQLSTKGVTSADLPLYANHNRGSYYWVDMMDWWEGNPDNGLKVSLHLGGAATYDSRMRLPLLQLVDTDNWRREYQGRVNNGRWRVGGVEPVYDYEQTPDLEPWARGCYGFRYKWWVEKNPFNYAGTASQRFWQAAVTADYNPRAAYCHRSPYDNGTDNGEQHHWYMWGPYAVDSQQGLPALSPERASHSSADGYRANPFFGGASSRRDHVYPIFDVPKDGERIVSIGRFQHAQLTPFIWHPTYAIGGSWVPPNQKSRGKSGDPVSQVSAAWTSQLPQMPAWFKQDRGRDEVVFDLSYEANHELWDRYFLSGSTTAEKANFAKKPADSPLANSRLVPAGDKTDPSKLGDFHQAASQLLLAGAFNVNSTDPEAWQALLASMKSSSLSSEGASYPRFISSQSGRFDPSKDPYDPKVWTGFRGLSDDQIKSLAQSLVTEIKKRGPFLSVSDFVNRRLVTENSQKADTGICGTLQKAIENAGLNDNLKGGDLSLNTTGFGEGSYEVGSNSSDWGSVKHLRESKAIGLPTYLQQGDFLQALGSILVARGDTFVVRAYGEALSEDGKNVEARAWCEAVVQRMPDYVATGDPAEQPAFSSTGTRNTLLSEASLRYGRKFRVTSFRWLSPSEV